MLDASNGLHADALIFFACKTSYNVEYECTGPGRFLDIRTQDSDDGIDDLARGLVGWQIATDVRIYQSAAFQLVRRRDVDLEQHSQGTGNVRSIRQAGSIDDPR